MVLKRFSIMKIYVYYEKNKKLNEESDVAAVKAGTLNEAIKILKNYYGNVTKDNVHELTFIDFDNKDTNIMIFSDY